MFSSRSIAASADGSPVAAAPAESSPKRCIRTTEGPLDGELLDLYVAILIVGAAGVPAEVVPVLSLRSAATFGV